MNDALKDCAKDSVKDCATNDSYGELIEPATLRIIRVLPGPIERVWSYLTKEELRSQWMASSSMEMAAGAPFEFVWRNHEFTKPPAALPPGVKEEYRMASTIIAFEPPHKLSFTWENSGNVTIELEPQGKDVQLTVIHRRLPNRTELLSVSAGWHKHLAILLAVMSNQKVEPFWEEFLSLKEVYDKRLPV
ncbi:SRPBCC family protein [soil metagenome]